MCAPCGLPLMLLCMGRYDLRLRLFVSCLSVVFSVCVISLEFIKFYLVFPNSVGCGVLAKVQEEEMLLLWEGVLFGGTGGVIWVCTFMNIANAYKTLTSTSFFEMQARRQVSIEIFTR